MKWHKVEDFPEDFNEYVLVSSKMEAKRLVMDCFVARKRDGYWYSNNEEYYIDSTDHWCYIDLPED